MIKAIMLSFFLFSCVAGHSQMSDEKSVQTVPEVDISKYMGRWYEISSYPQWFEKGMTNVSALYTMKDGYVDVLNSGIRDGEVKEAHGRAKVVNNSGNAKLKVSFFRPFYADYWIVDLDPYYQWVVVSNKDRTTLWILAREAYMNELLYQEICQKLADNGFDISKLVRMNQDVETK